MGREQGGDPLELSPREKLERDVKAAKARLAGAERWLQETEQALADARRGVAEAAARVVDTEAGVKAAEKALADFDAYELAQAQQNAVKKAGEDHYNDPQRCLQREAEAANERWWNEFKP